MRRLTPELVATVLGAVGLLCVVVAVGLLTSGPWALLLSGGLLVAVAYSVHTHAEPGAKPAARPRVVRERGAA